MEFCSLHRISLEPTQGWEVNQTSRSRAKIRSIGNRMDSGFSNVPMVLELIWSIQSRPVRHSVNYSFPSICVSLPSFNSNKSQCPVPRLEQVGQDLSLSPTTVFSEVIQILRSFWLPRNPNNPLLARSPLVPFLLERNTDPVPIPEDLFLWQETSNVVARCKDLNVSTFTPGDYEGRIG